MQLTKEQIEKRLKQWKLWKVLIKLNPNKYYMENMSDDGFRCTLREITKDRIDVFVDSQSENWLFE